MTSPLGRVNKLSGVLRIPFFFLLLLFLITSCDQPSNLSSKYHLSAEDQKWMEKFFYDFIVIEGGAYTLWGSKPVTELVLRHYTKEEWEEIKKTCLKIFQMEVL